MAEEPRWWEIRPAANLSASVYRCPLCDERLPALTEHLLLKPEGDASGRRHAHTQCVQEARREGRLPTRDEWAATQPRPPSLLRRLVDAIRNSRPSGGPP